MKLSCFLLFFFLLRSAPGFSDASSEKEARIRPVSVPAAAGSSVPRVTAGRDGALFLSWVEPSGNGAAFRFSTWKADRWSRVQTIAEGLSVLAAVSSEPGILELPDGALVAQWLTKAKEKEANHIVVAVSRDGGHTWSRPLTPYRDHTPGEHMYVSLFPRPTGGAGVVWLDPRGGSKTALFETTLDETGQLGPEHAIDGDVCSCCPTSSAVTSRGPLLLYRGHTPADVRDMQVTSLIGDVWQPAVSVHADGWKINGCPTNSGALAASGQKAAAAWFTAASGKKRVLLAFSNDAGQSFAEPVTVDEAAPIGRASLALLSNGSALTTWLSPDSTGTKLLVRAFVPGTGLLPARLMAHLAAGERFGFPFAAASNRQAMVVWTEWDGEKSRGIRAARLSFLKH